MVVISAIQRSRIGEDPDYVARREYVDQYNFDLLEGMEPMVFVSGGNLSGSDQRDEYGSIG